MIKVSSQKQISLLTAVILLLVLLVAPARAGIFPFTSSRTIDPSEYSTKEDRINAYNAQAIELFEDGRFEEAQQMWEKAISIMERSPGPIEPIEQEEAEDAPLVTEAMHAEIAKEEIKPSGDDTEDLYKAAVSLFKKQKYIASKKMFDRIERQIPDYKATRNYLTILKHKIKQVQQTLSGNIFQTDAVSRRAEREEWKRILEESEKELQERLRQQVEPMYEEALSYYKTRQFKLAKEFFEEINTIVPKYKDTIKYLQRIDADIRADEQLALKEKYKKQVLERKKEHEEWLRILKESEDLLQEKMKKQAEPIYEEALHYYKKRQFELAKSRFQEVELILPNYKATSKYLERIDDDIQEEEMRYAYDRERELQRQKREAEIIRKREEKRIAQIREAEEKIRMDNFNAEILARRKEREEWLKVLKETEQEHAARLEEQADFVYDQAVKLYKRKQLVQAKEEFAEVDSIIPGYKSTEKFLSKIAREISEERQARFALEQKLIQKELRAEHLAQRKKEEEERRLRAIADQRRLEEFKAQAAARKEQRELWDEVLKKNELERQKRFKQEAEYIYSEAMKAYNNKQYEYARNSFIEAQMIIPGYKKSEKMIAQIDQNIKLEEKRALVKAQEEAEYIRQQEIAARRKSEEQQIRRLRAEQIRQKKELEQKAEKIYEFAESLYKRQDFVKAKDKFHDVQELLPDYRSTQRYLARINDDIAKAYEREREEQENELRRELRANEFAYRRDEQMSEELLIKTQRDMQRKLKDEALARKKDREAWEQTIKKVEEENQKRLERQADLIYMEAMRYYDAGWYKQAKESFQEVDATVPGYKYTEKYLVKVEKQIRKEEKLREESEKLINDKWNVKPSKRIVTSSKNARWDTSTPDFVNQEIPKANGYKVVEQASILRQKEITKETELKYREALSYYKAKNYVEAKLKFIEVESFSPGYKATLDYLRRIDEQIIVQNQEMERANIARADKAFKPANSRSDLIAQALATHEQAYDVSKSVVNTKKIDQSAMLNERRKELKAQRKIVQMQYEKQFSQLYDRAIKMYKNGDYREAVTLFEQIEQMKPGYKRARSYIKKANAKLKKKLGTVNNAVAQSPKLNGRSSVIDEALDAFE